MLIKILIGVAVVVILFLVIVALQPADYRVVRSGSISAPPGIVFANVNDFHKWDAWSPWAKLDPNMKTSFDGPAAGVGAGYAWVGNSKVGEGSMKIIDSHPTNRVLIKLDFIKPFASTAETLFTFAPEGSGTAVTWNMSGRKNFMSKAFCMFMSMDKMVGGDFERGLASLKAVSEAAPKL
jgi:hypothetical protein